MYSKTCALFNKALVGIHPQLRQIPPSDSRSTTPTFIPSWAALIAATYPPGPLPMTIRSYFIILLFNYFQKLCKYKVFHFASVIIQLLSGKMIAHLKGALKYSNGIGLLSDKNWGIDRSLRY